MRKLGIIEFSSVMRYPNLMCNSMATYQHLKKKTQCKLNGYTLKGSNSDFQFCLTFQLQVGEVGGGGGGGRVWER